MAGAGWIENRGGELYFIEAESTRTGWVFSERSTYEVTWYQVPPKNGWIKRVEAIGTSQWTGDSGRHFRQSPRASTRQEIGVGDYCDNASTFAEATWMMNRGDVEQGVSMLNALRAHVVNNVDEKSRRLLLPLIEEAIEKECRRQTESIRVADSTGTSPNGTPALVPTSTRDGLTARHTNGDLVTRFKLHMIDVVAIVTALTWTHTMLVHEIDQLPGIAAFPAAANAVAGSRSCCGWFLRKHRDDEGICNLRALASGANETDFQFITWVPRFTRFAEPCWRTLGLSQHRQQRRVTSRGDRYRP
jgi:hypothetical protein